MNYGKAVEKLTAKDIRESTIWSMLYKPVGGPGKPDSIGRSLFSGMNFDITTGTLRSINEHLARLYGTGLIIPTYTRPPWFIVFP